MCRMDQGENLCLRREGPGAGLWAGLGERCLREEIPFFFSLNLNDGFMVMLYAVM